MRERCWKTRLRSSARSKRRAATGSSAASLPTARRSTGSRASSSPSPTSPNASTRPDALEAAKRQAQMANVAKSRFLATASHDLRQPLQTLALLQEQLTKAVEGDKRKKLVARLEKTLGTMAGMLNTPARHKPDRGRHHPRGKRNVSGERIARAAAGRVRLSRTGAQAGASRGRVASVDPQRPAPARADDPQSALQRAEIHRARQGSSRLPQTERLAEDRSLGHRRSASPQKSSMRSSREYHQLHNAAPERSLGLGLGLSIVRRLGSLLGHRISVRSSPGRGSVFSIEVPLRAGAAVEQPENISSGKAAPEDAVRRRGAILVIEDDPQMRELLEVLLQGEGHYVVTAPDGAAAVALIARGVVRPDVILTDYNLSDGMDGLEVCAKLREKLDRHVPVIVLTGDISTDVLRKVASHDCVQLNKPVKLTELSQAIQRLLPMSQAAGGAASRARRQGRATGRRLRRLRRRRRRPDSRCHANHARGRGAGRGNLSDRRKRFSRPIVRAGAGFLLIDAYLPGMSGMDLLRRLAREGRSPPAIVITGECDVQFAVEAMKAGASDFMEKPIRQDELLESIDRALEEATDLNRLSAWRGNRVGADRSTHVAAARDHGSRPCRASQQEYRGGSRHQPTHGRKPPRLDHAQDGPEVASRPGASGACRRRRRPRRERGIKPDFPIPPPGRSRADSARHAADTAVR